MRSDSRRRAGSAVGARALPRYGAAVRGTFRHDHQGQGLYRRRFRASDAACARQDRGAAPCRGGARRAGRRRADARRRRRLFLLRRRAGAGAGLDGGVHEPEAPPYGFDRDRRRLLHRACRARRRSDRARQMRRSFDHARRPAAQRGHGDRHRAAAARSEPAGSRLGGALRHHHRQRLRHVRDAPHVRIRHHQRAARLGEGRGFASRAAQSARHAARGRHRRGRTQLAADRRSAAPARLLRHQRRRRRAGAGSPGDRQDAEAAAGQDHRRRRSGEASHRRQLSISPPRARRAPARLRSPKPA